jgi:hypothetical protein
MTRITILAAAASIGAIGSANAAVPFFNATCPTGIEVHADEGGPIFINGKEATLKVFNKNAYEAKHGHVTLDLTIAPDGTPSLTYTKDGGANGICTIAPEYKPNGQKGHGNKNQGCPPNVSEANRYQYPGCK